MNRLATQRHDLVSRLGSLEIDFFALYVEEVNRSSAEERFLDFDGFYDEISVRFLEALTHRDPEKEDLRDFRSEQSDVYDALETYRLSYGIGGKPPSLRGGGFTCID